MRWHGTIKLEHQRPVALRATPARAIGGNAHTIRYRGKKKKGNSVFGNVERYHIPHQKTNFLGLEESKRSENEIVPSSFLSAIKKQHIFPFTIFHCEGMQYPRPIANAASQTLTISVSASYSSLSASPPSFFPSWCLFFIWSDDSTNTVSWRLLLSHQSSDSTYKD